MAGGWCKIFIFKKMKAQWFGSGNILLKKDRRRGGSVVVSMLALYTDDLSSEPAEVYPQFFC